MGEGALSKVNDFIDLSAYVTMPFLTAYWDIYASA